MLDSLKALQKNPQFWTQVAVGGILVWLSSNVYFLLPLILLPLGYAFSLMKGTLHGKDELPAWSEIGSHVVNGIFAFVLCLTFLLPAGILICFAAFPTLSASALGVAIQKFLSLGFFMLACAGFSMFLMALARYAATGRFASAFELAPLLSQIKTCINEFALIVLWCAFASTFLMSFGGTLANMVPFGIVFLLMGAGWFLLWMVCSHATGSLYRRCFLLAEPGQDHLALKLPAKDTLGAGLNKIKLDDDETDASLTRIRGDNDSWA